MDFGLTPEQEMLQRTARDVLVDLAPMTRVREMMTDPSVAEPAWRRLVELGWPGLLFPEEYGGSGLGMLELAIVLEEMGRAVLPGPFFSTVVGGLTVLAGGDDAQRRRWLTPIATGAARATVALLEEGARWDLSGVTAVARPDRQGLVVSGAKLFVPDADTADVLFCAVRRADDGELALVAVERGARGLAIAPLASMDQTRRVFAVTLDEVHVGADRALRCDAAAALERVLDQARVALAAEMCGGAARVLEITVEYAKVRQQFGRPIGSFQAIQHECADMMVEVEKAKAAAYYAAWAEAAQAPDAALAAAMAKALAGDAYRHVAAQSIQVHGGIGFTWEHDLHIYFKRAQSSEMTYGDATWSRELVAQRLGL